jgi:hypothetical protein
MGRDSAASDALDASGLGAGGSPQDSDPRTFVYSDEARKLLATPPTEWDPRDFSTDENTRKWWAAAAVYGGILFAVGVEAALGWFSAGTVFAFGLLILILVALAVLALLGLELGVGVFLAGGTLVVASLPGLTFPYTYWLASQFAMCLAGGLFLGIGVIMVVYLRSPEGDKELTPISLEV